MMLNDIDRKLSALHLDTRIVLLAYVDLLWPPQHQRIQNPDRFVLMFAPITRTYSKTVSTDRAWPELPPVERNKLTLPHMIEENLAFLRAWQAQFVTSLNSQFDCKVDFAAGDLPGNEFDWHMSGGERHAQPAATIVFAQQHHDCAIHSRGL